MVMTVRRSVSTSLRVQTALVIVVLSALPNLVMATTVLLPAYQRAGELTPATWVSLVLWMVGVVMVSAAIGFLLSKRLLEPLLSLGRDVSVLPQTVRRLAAARLPVSGKEPREVLSLKRSFNDLLEQVQLEQSRRNAFMATLMHDLKTPLIAANHLLDVVLDDQHLSREERVDVVSQLVDENQALIDLVQKMVDAHRFEREDVALKRQLIPLGPLLHTIMARVRPLAEEGGISLEVRGEATVSVDPKEFERALYNLVSNAVRYAHSRITVEIYSGVIRLSDDGPGLPAPLDKLAQPFSVQPVEIAGERYAAGAGGLGLFIARRIVEAHGGRLVTEITGGNGTVLLIYVGSELR
jgi:signal transduction histidine kinase